MKYGPLGCLFEEDGSSFRDGFPVVALYIRVYKYM